MATASRKKARARRSRNEPDDWIVVNDQVHIPTTVVDFDSFREWCKSDGYPEYADVFWIGGMIWVGVGEAARSAHNSAKQEIARGLDNLVRETQSGMVIADQIRLVNEGATLFVAPDLMYISTDSVRRGQVQIQSDKSKRIVEIEGTPDMVLNVVDNAAEKKDKRLRQSYFAAGISEYWRVDARGEQIKFDILRRGPKGFVATPRRNGRVKSAVFGRTFELLVKTGPIGIPKFTLEVLE